MSFFVLQPNTRQLLNHPNLNQEKYGYYIRATRLSSHPRNIFAGDYIRNMEYSEVQRSRG